MALIGAHWQKRLPCWSSIWHSSSWIVSAPSFYKAVGTPAEPVAFLENATLPEQRLIETTLGEAVTVAEVIGLQPPAIFVVGEVVARRLVSSQAPPAVESATESVTESVTESTTEKTMPNTYQESASQG